jgi:hypothetical protein
MSKFVEFKIEGRVGLAQSSNIIHILPWKEKDGKVEWQVKLGDSYYYYNDSDAKALMEEIKNADR